MNLQRGFKRLIITLLIAEVLFMLLVYTPNYEGIHTEIVAIVTFFAFPPICLLLIWLTYCSCCWVIKGFRNISGKQKRSKIAAISLLLGFIGFGLLPGLSWMARDFEFWVVLLTIGVFLCTLASIISGVFALIQIRKSKGLLEGKDTAIMGLFTATAGLVFAASILMAHGC